MRPKIHRALAWCCLLAVDQTALCQSQPRVNGQQLPAITREADGDADGTASTAPPAVPDAPTDPPDSFFEILHSAGVIGYLIVGLSVAAAALAIEHLVSLRRSMLLPVGLGERVRLLVRDGQWAEAEQACRAQPSLLAAVLLAGLNEAGGQWSHIEKCMEDTLAEQAARLFRRLEYLAVIGNVAPMLGLLGTVLGMIFAFREVATSQGAARAADLAEGIYLALVTTVEGLVVAIPALALYALFRNRVDQLVSEAANVAQAVFAPWRRRDSTARQATGDA